jgi:hypothetical protein
MGLEWVLDKTKARPGLERRFAELSSMVQQMEKDGVGPGPSTAAQLEAVSMSCFEVIGAPRIGIDEEATEFFRTQIYEPARREALTYDPGQRKLAWGMRPFEEVLDDNRGKWVVHLAKEKGGFSPVEGPLAWLDFPGKRVGDAEPELGRWVTMEAYEDHSPEACLSYAKSLEEALDGHRDGSVKHLLDAISWLRFWGERGFGFKARG